MTVRSVATMLVVTLAVVACDPAPIASPPVTAEPSPAAVQRLEWGVGASVGQDGGLVRRRPTSSAAGLVVGRDYLLETGHCGLDMPMDFDGGFWLPVEEPANSLPFEGQVGTFRLETETEGTFIVGSGHSVRLRRVTEEHSFRLCA